MRVAVRRSLTAVVFLLPLGIILFLGFKLVVQFRGRVERDLAPILAAELHKTLGHEVRVGKVTFDGKHAFVDNVHVARLKTFADSNDEDIASARQVVLDFDLQRILLSNNPAIPYFANIRAIDSVFTISRNDKGIWNFADLIKPQAEPAARQLVARLFIENGRIVYSDAAIPHQQARHPRPLNLQGDKVNGHLEFYEDRSAAWNLKGNETTGTAGAMAVLGTWEPEPHRLFLRIDIGDLSAPIANRFLPPDADIVTGTVGGQITIVRTPDTGGPLHSDVEVDAKFNGVTVASARLAEPIQQLSGEATLTNGITTTRLDAGFAGSRLHAEGTVFGLTDPEVDGWATGNAVELQRMLAALKVENKVPALKGVVATADVRAGLRGPLKDLSVTASGQATARGSVASGPQIPANGTVQVSFSGPWNRPQFTADGTLPLVRFQKLEARNVRLAATYRGELAAVQFTGATSGGLIAGNANVRPNGKHSTYTLNVHARNVDLGRLPLRTEKPLSGIANLDIAANGRLDQQLPQGSVLVQVKRLKYDNWHADRTWASIRSTGAVITIQPLVIERGQQVIVASGSVDRVQKQLNLNLDADEIDLASIPQLADSDLSGRIYIRNGIAKGDWKNPTISAELRGYGNSAPVEHANRRFEVDFAAARVQGNRENLYLEDGQVWRFPEFAQIDGVISRPLSETPRIHLAGSFGGVDLQDLADLAGRDEKASGIASGTFVATGTLKKPVVEIDQISVDHPAFGDYYFDKATASLTYDGTRKNPLLSMSSFAADVLGTHITGNASLTGGRFTADLATADVDLSLLQVYAKDYAAIKGRGRAHASLSGKLVEGKAEELAGTIEAGSTGLRLNSQDFGELTARLHVAKDRIVTDDVRLGDPTNGIRLADTSYVDIKDKSVNLKGAIGAISLQTLRLAVENSPSVVTRPDNPINEFVKPLTNPFEGTIGGSFQVAGKFDELISTVHWEGRQMAIEGEPIEQFTGDIRFDNKMASLQRATLNAGPTQIVAKGEYRSQVPDLAGTIDITELRLPVFRRWFPSQGWLKGLEGTADIVSVRSSGDPSAPNLDATLELSNVTWQDPRTTTASRILNGKKIVIPRVSTSDISVRNGQLRVADISAVLQGVEAVDIEKQTGVAGGPTAGPGVDPKSAAPESTHKSVPGAPAVAPLRTVNYETHIRDVQIPFAWTAPLVKQESISNFTVAIPKQGLGILASFVPEQPPGAKPKPPAVLNGTIDLELTYEGALRFLTDREYRESFTVRQPSLKGFVEIHASRLASAMSLTEIRDLDGKVSLDGDRLHVDHFTARTQVIGPRFSSRKSQDIKIEGDLGIQGDAQGLTITAPRVVIAESPIPGLGGSVVADLSTDDPKTTAVESLHVTGKLFDSTLQGGIYIRNTDFRMPDAFSSAGFSVVPIPIVPKFDLAFYVGDSVRVSTAQLSAYVRSSDTDKPTLKGGLDNLQVGGTLIVDRGTLTFPTARFAIQRGGTISMRYPYYSVDVPGKSFATVVDLTASTHITATSLAGTRKRYTITVDARGPVGVGAPIQIIEPGSLTPPSAERGLRLTFRSDQPDLGAGPGGLQRTVLGLLGGQTAIENLFSRTPNFSRTLTSQAADILSASFLPGFLERTGLARALGLEELDIEYSQLDAFTFRLSRQLVGPFYVGYWRRLSGANLSGTTDRAAWEVKLSYRALSNLQISYTFDEQRTNAYLVEGVFKF